MQKFIVNCFVVIALLLTQNTNAGELKEFEEKAIEIKNDVSSKDPQNNNSSSDESEKASFGEKIVGAIIGEFLNFIFVAPGIYSFGRVGKQVEMAGYQIDDISKIPRREKGDFLLPKFQIDLVGGLVNYDITHSRVRIETGIGPIGGQYSNAYLFEMPENDHIFIQSLSGIYRMSFGKRVTIGLGFGGSSLHGDNNTFGVNLTFPMKFNFDKNMSLYYRPIISSFSNEGTFEHSTGFVYDFKKYSAVISYTSFSAQDKTLKGISLGVMYTY